MVCRIITYRTRNEHVYYSGVIGINVFTFGVASIILFNVSYFIGR